MKNAMSSKNANMFHEKVKQSKGLNKEKDDMFRKQQTLKRREEEKH